jgi:diacylglycerol kinase
VSRPRSALASFAQAFAGIGEAVRKERHMRFHLLAAAAVALVALWLRVSRQDWLWLLSAIFAVWTAELVNTAIERTVDLAAPGLHPLARSAKDIAAGAVLAASLYAALVGLLVLGPPLWNRCFG